MQFPGTQSFGLPTSSGQGCEELLAILGRSQNDCRFSLRESSVLSRRNDESAADDTRLKSLAQKNNADQIVFAYEASGLGHGLSDQLHNEKHRMLRAQSHRLLGERW